jgi:hypothetical protein
MLIRRDGLQDDAHRQYFPVQKGLADIKNSGNPAAGGLGVAYLSLVTFESSNSGKILINVLRLYYKKQWLLCIQIDKYNILTTDLQI